MHSYLMVTLFMLLAYLAGTFISMFIKMADINNANADYTIGSVFRLFFKKEWPSYGASISFGFLYAFSHDEWITWFTTSKYTANTFLAELTGFIYIFSALLGFCMQHGIYKFWLGKLDKKVRDVIGVEKTETTVQTTTVTAVKEPLDGPPKKTDN